MNKYSTIFDRIIVIVEKKGFKNVAELAEKLGYASPQKIYRLKQEENSKPSYDIIRDFSNKFEDLDLRWFVTGEGTPFTTEATSAVSEPRVAYGESEEVKLLRDKIKELEIEKKSLLLALREIGAGQSVSDPAKNSAKKRSE